jgi:hypothetical protein
MKCVVAVLIIDDAMGNVVRVEGMTPPDLMIVHLFT